jgi:prepilin-type N-terminal cleavage/methylation domain-containing protein
MRPRWVGVAGARLAGEEHGFTIVELMAAISIFALVVTGITALMGTSLNLTRNNRNRAVGANLASQEMDVVRSTTFTDLPLGQVTTTQTVDGVPYSVIRETEWVTQNATTGPCQAPSGTSPA